MSNTLEIACDEAGHTGPDLLNQDQRYFAFSSVSVGDDEAFEIVSRARRDHPVQMPELKGARLLGTETGTALIKSVFQAVEGRYAVALHDKLLALCGWFFEYVYEPVYKDDPTLLYRKGFHRFVAMFTWIWMHDNQLESGRAIAEFQRYTRSCNQDEAPFLFASPQNVSKLNLHPFNAVLAFAYGYRERILADNARLRTELPEGGRWTLDLSASGLLEPSESLGPERKPARRSLRCQQALACCHR